MATVIISCRVEDSEQWLVSPERDALFAAFGMTELRTFVGALDPTKVALVVEAPPPGPDEEAADLRVFYASMAAHPAVLEVLATDGVIPGTLEYLVER